MKNAQEAGMSFMKTSLENLLNNLLTSEQMFSIILHLISFNLIFFFYLQLVFFFFFPFHCHPLYECLGQVIKSSYNDPIRHHMANVSQRVFNVFEVTGYYGQCSQNYFNLKNVDGYMHTKMETVHTPPVPSCNTWPKKIPTIQKACRTDY